MIYRIMNVLTPRQWFDLGRWAARCSEGPNGIQVRVRQVGHEAGYTGELEIWPPASARFWASHASLGAKGLVVLDPDPESQRRRVTGTIVGRDGIVVPVEITI